VEKFMSEGSNRYDALRACALYSDVKTAIATQRFFPYGCRVYGSLGKEDNHYMKPYCNSIKYLLLCKFTGLLTDARMLGIVDLTCTDFTKRLIYYNTYEDTLQTPPFLCFFCVEAENFGDCECGNFWHPEMYDFVAPVRCACCTGINV